MTRDLCAIQAMQGAQETRHAETQYNNANAVQKNACKPSLDPVIPKLADSSAFFPASPAKLHPANTKGTHLHGCHKPRVRSTSQNDVRCKMLDEGKANAYAQRSRVRHAGDRKQGNAA